MADSFSEHGLSLMQAGDLSLYAFHSMKAVHEAAVAAAEERGRNAQWADEASTYREHRQDGYEQGQRDALANLDNAAVYARIMKVLDDNGINNEGGLHSWRCFDKERYPVPCSCAGEVVVEILAAIKGDSDE